MKKIKHSNWGILAVMTTFGLFSVAANAIAAGGPDLGYGTRVIYGDDDRKDMYEVSNQMLRNIADSTVALMKSSSVTVSGSVAKIKGEQFGSSFGLCKEEPFYEQPSSAFCSGSLVGPDVILTAGHCIRNEADCASTKFVFGFGVYSAGTLPTEVAAKDVVSCKQIIAREQVGSGADYAVIRIDRKVKDHRPLELDESNLKKGANIVVIGHPSGLPTKVAGGAQVRDFNKPGFFVANLDTYGGNSGSAVFSATTGKVVGVLVRGENDFIYKQGENCRISNRCPADGCRGEDVTKISAAADIIRQANGQQSRTRRSIWPFPRRNRGGSTAQNGGQRF